MAAFWIYFAAYPLLSKEDGFIRVEFLVDRFSKAARRIASIVITVAVIAFHVILFRLCVVTLEVVSIYETPMEAIIRTTAAFLPTLIFALLVLTYVPFLSTWLPTVLFPDTYGG